MHRKILPPILGLASVSLILVGCGVSPSASTSAHLRKTPSPVSSLVATKTEQIVSANHTATFVVTAKTASGKPAAERRATFYIGPMVPLSNVPPTHWYASDTRQAAQYIIRVSTKTNASGQAIIVLRPQATHSMEMIGVRIGNLSSFSSTTHKAIGSLDAWWTAEQSPTSPPIGDWVKLSPWVSIVKPNTHVSLTAQVHSSRGPVNGASISFAAKSSQKNMSSMNASSSMSSGTMLHSTTNASGQATEMFATGAANNVMPIRVVVVNPTTSGRLSGGMNAEFITR